jgi:hypothetical protein
MALPFSRVPAALLLAAAPLLGLLGPGCKLLHKAASDAGPDGSPDAAAAAEPAPSASEAPAEPAPSASASASAHAVAHPAGPPAAGNPCSTGIACATDGFEELACAGGVWHVMQTCRGPGACKTENGIVKCDPGVPRAGDACMPTAAVPRCIDIRSVLVCEKDRWVASLCVPPSKCQANAKNGQPGCK